MSVLTASKVWMRRGTLAPSLAPASGLALMRPHLLSAKFLHVQISNLELNAKFVSPKGLKVPWHVAFGGCRVWSGERASGSRQG